MEEKELKNIEEIDETKENEASEEVKFSKRYSIPFDMFENAYTVFQKKYVYPRNYIMSGVLFILAILNVINIVVGKASPIGYLLVFVCLALIAVNLYNPKKIKRNLLEGIKEIENDVYTLECYSDKMVIGTVLEPLEEEVKEQEEYEEVFGKTEPQEEIYKTDIYLTNNVRVIERSEYFMVYIVKANFYVIPKRAFSDNEISEFAMYFSGKIGSNFICEADK